MATAGGLSQKNSAVSQLLEQAVAQSRAQVDDLAQEPAMLAPTAPPAEEKNKSIPIAAPIPTLTAQAAAAAAPQPSVQPPQEQQPAPAPKPEQKEVDDVKQQEKPKGGLTMTKDEPKPEEKKEEKKEPEAAPKKDDKGEFAGAPACDDPYYDADFKMLEMGDEMDYANEER